MVGFALLGSSPSASEGRVHMDNTTSFTLDRTDEEILAYTVSDEALEAAAGTERAAATQFSIPAGLPNSGCCSGDPVKVWPGSRA